MTSSADGSAEPVAGSQLAVRAIDAARYRTVLSHYPTGVCAVTAMHEGEPTGFVVGSFTSISLEPALAGFFPDKSSTTFPKVRAAGAFCANVLSAEDESLCRLFAAKDADRFASIAWRAGATGAPILDRATAWVECEIEQVLEVGDHLLVVGRVIDLAEGSGADPLLFHRGRYGSYASTAREMRR
ncbi:MAG: flavin reductase family protein [Jatrophihabitantaceae bacterium]